MIKRYTSRRPPRAVPTSIRVGTNSSGKQRNKRFTASLNSERGQNGKVLTNSGQNNNSRRSSAGFYIDRMPTDPSTPGYSNHGYVVVSGWSVAHPSTFTPINQHPSTFTPINQNKLFVVNGLKVYNQPTSGVLWSNKIYKTYRVPVTAENLPPIRRSPVVFGQVPMSPPATVYQPVKAHPEYSMRIPVKRNGRTTTSRPAA